MKHDLITTEKHLQTLCDRLGESSWIAFDTEFVSEFTYYPDLCLVQVAACERDSTYLAVIDTKREVDLKPFWQVLSEGTHQTIVHAGREEFRFCTRAIQAIPKNWFDIQLAAGLLGHEYPASYGKLVSRFLQKPLQKGETRSDWRRRPLTKSQLDYALQDVLYLQDIASMLAEDLRARGRLEWMQEEIGSWMNRVEESENQERWRRLSGMNGLSTEALRIARHLWHWREEQAQLMNCPPRRILRDDLIVELARRGRTNAREIRLIRGMEYRNVRDKIDDIAMCIEEALEDQTALPSRPPLKLPPQADMLEKFLNTALSMICRQEGVAQSIVGTMQDIRELLAYELGTNTDAIPALSRGWRKELVGSQISDLLKGKASLRILDPMAEAPITVNQS